MDVDPKNMQVFVTGEISQAHHQRLACLSSVKTNQTGNSLSDNQFALQTHASDAILCVVFDRIDRQFMESHAKLKLIANCGVGYNNIDVDAASERAILVTNTPDVVTEPTADLTFALLLSCARRIVEADRFVRSGAWRDLTDEAALFGTNLTNKTLGIIGMGRIGKAVARRAAAFQMKIVYTARSDNAESEAHLKAEFGAIRLPLCELLESCDVVSVHCPLLPETRHLLGKPQFAQMKPGCILINASRGAIIDEAAMVKALESKQIAGAGLDVFEFEPAVSPQLLKMPNVVLTPHIGTASSEIRDAMANLAIEGLLQAFAGKLPENAVNKHIWPAFLERLKQ